MINWIATNNNITGSYYLSKSHTCYIISSLLQHVLKISASNMNTNVYMLLHSPNRTFNNRATQSGPLAVDASFQFAYVRDLGTMDLLLINVK